MKQPAIGIDVSKHHLDIATHGSSQVRRLTNSPQGQHALLRRIQNQQPRAVVLEATGGYEQAALSKLAEAGLPVTRINPRQARDFAKATGQLAKTDVLDAQVLAQLAATVELPRYQAPGPAHIDLQALVKRRQALIRLRDSERNRLAQAAPAARPNIQLLIESLQQALTDIEDRIAAQYQTSPRLKSAIDRLCQIPGIGRTTAASLVALLPELGQLNRKAIAKLTGVAPLNCDSGQQRGHRHIWGGRQAPRCALYMAALVGTRSNPDIKALYDRLRERGKPGKVALTACMRKLLTIANAMLREQSDWMPQPDG